MRKRKKLEEKGFSELREEATKGGIGELFG